MASSLDRIYSQVGAAVAPIFSAVITGPTTAIVVPFDLSQQSAVNTYMQSTFDWSDAAELTWQRLQDANLLDASDRQVVLLRGVVGVLVDELNILREWLVSFKAAVAGAGTLAALKTAVAALPDTPDRTLTQARTAVKAKINAGTVDN